MSSGQSPAPSERVQMVYNFCKRCGLSRIDLLNKCDCGVAREGEGARGSGESTTLDIGGHQVKMRSLLYDEEADDPALNPLLIDPVNIRPEALPLNVAWKDDSIPGWKCLRTVMDSGAAESVGPPTMASGLFPIQESPGSMRGQQYIAAGHERIPNLGQQVLNVVTNEGHETQALFQIVGL